MSDPIGPVHFRSCGFGTDSGELWLAKKDIANDPEALANPAVTLQPKRLVRVKGGTVQVGSKSYGWIRTDGDECPESPEYVYIVTERRI